MIFTLGFTTAAPAADSPFFAFLPFQGDLQEKNNFAIRDIDFVLNAGTISDIGLVVLSANGTPDPASTFECRLENRMDTADADASLTQIVTGWNVAPTRDATKTLKRVRLPAIEGASVSWSWDEFTQIIGGQTGAPHAVHLGTVALWNLGVAAASALTVTVRIEENTVLSPQRVNYGLRTLPVD